MVQAEQISFLVDTLLGEMPAYRPEAAQIAVSTVRKHLKTGALQKLVFCVHGDENLQIYKKLLCHIAEQPLLSHPAPPFLVRAIKRP